MWTIDLEARTATHESGFQIRSDGADRWVIVVGKIYEDSLLREGKDWYHHFYSKNYIRSVQERYNITLSDIAKYVQHEIDDNPQDDYGFKNISESDIRKYLEDREPLFTIQLCSLVRKAIYFQHDRKST